MIDIFYLITGIGFVLSLVVQGWLKTTYARWSRVRNSLNMPGASVARQVLDQNQMPECRVTQQTGRLTGLTDHYDPRNHKVSLSDRIYHEPSVASAAIAAHESGHALQDQDGYGPMRLRAQLLPIAQLGAQYGPWAAMGGWMLGSSTLVQVGFVMFAASLLFQLVNLPIEFDASRRAQRQLQQIGLDTQQDRQGVREVLRAAAMTYVAGAATAMGHLLLILFIAVRTLIRTTGAVGR